MGADKLAENTPNVPKFICTKRLHWASVVRAFVVHFDEISYVIQESILDFMITFKNVKMP